jgi:hypothetical protein
MEIRNGIRWQNSLVVILQISSATVLQESHPKAGIKAGPLQSTVRRIGATYSNSDADRKGAVARQLKCIE